MCLGAIYWARPRAVFFSATREDAAEAGFDLNLSPAATLGVSYSGQFASDLTDNAVKGRFTWLF